MSEIDPHALAVGVKQAFEAAREGDFCPSSKLGRLGPAVVPLLKPYLSDSDEAIRAQVVALLGLAGGDEALELLATALADASADVRERSALQLYEHFGPPVLTRHPTLGEALRGALTRGDHSAAAVLLLGYYPGAESERALSNLLAEKATAQTKLHPWSPVVPVALPAEMALSRLGEGNARQAMLRRIEGGDLDELVFLLEGIREVDAPVVLHALKATLADEREIRGGGLPSGAEPRRRLADLAVDAFVGRLRLDAGFAVGGGRRYSEDEVSRVRARIDAAVPR